MVFDCAVQKDIDIDTDDDDHTEIRQFKLLIQVRKMLDLKACVCTFQLRKFTGWGSEGVTGDRLCP